MRNRTPILNSYRKNMCCTNHQLREGFYRTVQSGCFRYDSHCSIREQILPQIDIFDKLLQRKQGAVSASNIYLL